MNYRIYIYIYILICFVICVCVFVTLTFTVFCLCTYLYCFVVILLFYVFLCFVVFIFVIVLCIFIFVCTSLGLLPPGESPIAVNNNNNNIYYSVQMFLSSSQNIQDVQKVTLKLNLVSFNVIHFLCNCIIYVKLKDRRCSLSETMIRNHCGFREAATIQNFALWLLLKSHNAF
jgi:hypothetical protein